MDSLYLLGDVHFSADQPWRLPTGDLFLAWLDSVEIDDDSSLLLLGDYTDDSVNPGEVVRQLDHLFEIASRRFKHVYALVGNHDLKLFKNKPQLTIEYVSSKPNVTILREPAEIIEICGMRTLSLPHFNYRNDLPVMTEHYANLKGAEYEQEFDLCVGHFPDTSTPLFGHMIDLSYLPINLYCLGDIHTRVSDHYIGSCFACKTSEVTTPLPRGMWKVTKTGDKVVKEEIRMPIFCDFRVATYPEPLPNKNEEGVTVWTILGADTIGTAEEYYPDTFIRGVTLRNKKVDKETVVSSVDFEIGTPLDIYQSWMKEVKKPIARNVNTTITNLLTV